MTGHAFADPLLDPAVGVLDVAALGGASNDAFERHAGRYVYGGVNRIKERSILVVANDQAILAIVEREGLRDALNRDRQPLAAFANLPQVRSLDLDSRVPEDAERICHSADLVAVVATRHVDRRVARGKAAHRRGNVLNGSYDWGTTYSTAITIAPATLRVVMRKSKSRPLRMAWAVRIAAASLPFWAVRMSSSTSLPRRKTSELLACKDAWSNPDLA